MRFVLLVGSGTLRWPEEPEKSVAFDVLVEWALEGESDGSPDGSLETERQQKARLDD